MQKTLVLLPKLGSYRFKSIELKSSYEEIVEKELKRFLENGHELYCIQEDMLALTLFSDIKDVKWITLYNDRDKVFLNTNVEDFPKELYKQCTAEYCREDVHDVISKKCKVMTIRDCKGDVQQYNYNKYMYLQKKLRVGAGALAGIYGCVLQFMDGNNFHDIVKPKMGDGKLIVTVDLVTAVKTVHYGGCPINQDAFEQLLEVI